MSVNGAKIGIPFGLICFLVIQFIQTPADMDENAMDVLAVATLMAIWWITEAIPIPATALLPILLFPLLGVKSGSEVTLAYANHLIYLFLGGFLIAVTVEKWNLHRRIALHIINLIGVTPNRIILGFMCATAGLSMWISNTAASMMMLTIAMAVVSQITFELGKKPELNIDTNPGQFRFGTALMLSIGYSASIGGVATLIGTPPNAILAGVIEKTYGVSISFVDWIMVGLPVSLVMLLITWFILSFVLYKSEIKELPGGRQTISNEIAALGPMTRQEKAVLAVFISVAVLWILRGLFESESIEMITDSTIAMAGALALFLIPSDLKKREFLLDWQTAVKIPWDILILFGGGFALAQGFSETGLTQYIGNQLTVLEGINIILVIAMVSLLVIFLTEITSNTATASLFLPIMTALAVAMQIHPYGLMIAAALSASFAFMLPVATPPNAVVFSSRYISIRQMAKTGIWLNLIGVILITATVICILPSAWNINLGIFPAEMLSIINLYNP